MEIKKNLAEFYNLLSDIRQIAKKLLKYKSNTHYRDSFKIKIRKLERSYISIKKELCSIKNQKLISLWGNIKGDIETITEYKNPESTIDEVDYIEEKIWNKIEIELENLDPCGGDFTVIHISGKTGWTDRNKKFSDFLKGLKGEIVIVDSYYGLGSLHVLDNFSEDTNVKFLTAQMGSDENPEKMNKELRRFKKEFPNIALRKYPKFWELHDRYILSEDMLIWVGHGLKDFGDKECFLVGIPIEKIPEVSKTLRLQFKERWEKADNLT